ncbi:hypothetical protein EGR_09549 [Echinococcus granulosus]|uniref:Uncharacterized protein n=1 Tax=Echinococcus granulosus TaxID=6210 RepID=W6UQD4_ECHGR|nr:hypothetical protein EGR_09549 [Echinococcus granulosus]EUB55609.1 hypothetical protein EGR_09549 [Echinococcus granulosus]
MIRARRSLDRRVLLDFGCSKGILSILDAKAGAAYVYTPDGVASLCQLPRQIIAENLFSCTTGYNFGNGREDWEAATRK